jgi:transcriptional regulator with XRE-family HTH domain
MKNYREHLGEVLKKERISQNRPLRDVSKSAFMSLGYLSEVERGLKEISSEMLELLCEALFMSVQSALIEVVVSMNAELEIEAPLELSVL